MSGIIGSRLNTRGSGLVGSLGTDGQVLTSSGAGAGAVMEDAGGGAYTLLNTTTVSSAASSTVDNHFTSDYRDYLIRFDLIPATESALRMQFTSAGDGTALTASNYMSLANYKRGDLDGSVGTDQEADMSGSYFQICADNADVLNSALYPFNSMMWIWNPLATTNYKMTSSISMYYGDSAQASIYTFRHGGMYQTAQGTAVTGIKLYMESGDITSATIKTYGIS